jgi:hypothetical protein
MRATTAVVVVLALVTAACGTYRPLTSGDAPRLNSLFQQRMATDDEIRPDIVRVSEVTVRDRGLAGDVVVNGKSWSDKSRTQQERLVKKIGAHMQSALYEAQPDLPRATFTVRLHNDLNEWFGFILVGGSNDQGGVSYNVR